MITISRDCGVQPGPEYQGRCTMEARRPGAVLGSGRKPRTGADVRLGCWSSPPGPGATPGGAPTCRGPTRWPTASPRGGAGPGGLVRWPFPRLAPCRRRELRLTRKYGLGDVLMCTPALARGEAAQPRLPAHGLHRFPANCSTACRSSTAPSRRTRTTPRALWLCYERSLPPVATCRGSSATSSGWRCGTSGPPARSGQDLVERFRREWGGRPRPVVIVTRHASNFTPNKEWPAAYWDDLVARLAARGTVVEVGGAADRAPGPAGGQLPRPQGSHLAARAGRGHRRRRPPRRADHRDGPHRRRGRRPLGRDLRGLRASRLHGLPGQHRPLQPGGVRPLLDEGTLPRTARNACT